MADYRELLRRAVDALPENNGAARRQVYEKARSALVAQLRAINPPLPAREITQHRLQLEDCIRQVEQDATDILLGGLKQLDDTATTAKAAETKTSERKIPETKAAPKPAVKTESPVVAAGDVAPDSAADTQNVAKNTFGSVERDDAAALEDALKKQADASEVSAVQAKDTPKAEKAAPVEIVGLTQPSDSIEKLIEEAEAERPVRQAPKPGSIDYLIAQAQAAADRAAVPTRWKNDNAVPEMAVAAGGGTAAAVAIAEPVVGTAVLADAEVEEAPTPASAVLSDAQAVDAAFEAKASEGDPQGAIDRAIETLDREARGESASGDQAADADADAGNFDKTQTDGELSSGNAVTIFLFLFVLLLAGVGGAGYWAWREGYIDLDAMFGQGVPVEQVALTDDASTAGAGDAVNGPGNTAATPDAVVPISQELGKSDERLSADANVGDAAPAAAQSVRNVASASTSDNKIEERLPTESSFGSEAAAPDSAAVADAGDDTLVAAAGVAPIGGQSLLLEASSGGTTGAVPFSGTVDWTRGVDELGQPTLIAHANIPARNLGVDLLIRRNSDPTLPASHLMEVDFVVSDSFVGGAIAGLPGILLKNEELVKGVPLIGASARVVGNSFLFALSAADQDVNTNTNLLGSRKWIDLALVYATGIRAIITLEKDEPAQVLFEEVMAAWSTAAQADADAVAASTAQ